MKKNVFLKIENFKAAKIMHNRKDHRHCKYYHKYVYMYACIPDVESPLLSNSKSEKCCECARLYVCNRVTDSFGFNPRKFELPLQFMYVKWDVELISIDPHQSRHNAALEQSPTGC